MKKAPKAAILSALILPGVGHTYLKHYVRGASLMLLSVAALSVLINSAYQRAMLVVDRIVSGDVPIDAMSITEMVTSSANVSDSLIDTAALPVLIACWLIGIVDSYRLGTVQDALLSTPDAVATHPETRGFTDRR